MKTCNFFASSNYGILGLITLLHFFSPVWFHSKDKQADLKLLIYSFFTELSKFVLFVIYE